MMKSSSAVRLKVRVREQDLEPIAISYARFAREHRLPSSVRRDMYVALDEILSNIVRHGSRGRTPTVSVTLAVRQNQFVIDIVDNGPPFDPFSHHEPDLAQPPAERPVGGLGVLFVRRLTDVHTYVRRSNLNHIHLAIELRANQPAARLKNRGGVPTRPARRRAASD